ncbi:MAG: hypothetical protein U1E22_07815, partial [Coriobacteriia bacterium]|nr:hypothetical protein [Coriobacteriia bacterium]
MTQTYRFFAGAVGDARAYGQTEFAEVLTRVFRNGVFPAVGGDLAVSPTDPAAMAVRVAAGQGWINGYWYGNDDFKTVTLVAADPNNPRIDRIVLRLDVFTARKIVAERLTGTPAATPAPPALTRTADYWELSLAQVYVAAGAASIVAANITDERGDSTLCGQAVPRDVVSLLLGETSITAYRGDRGKTAYDHSQAVTGAEHG